MLLTLDELYFCRESVPAAALDKVLFEEVVFDGAFDKVELDEVMACSTSGCLLLPWLHSQQCAGLSSFG